MLLVILFGFYPAPLLDVTAVSVKKLVSGYEAAIKAAHGLERALGGRRHATSCRHYWPLYPELVLVVGAMALLMLGVFRPESDREAEAIGWLAIGVLGAGGLARRSSSRRAGRRCSTAPSWSTASAAS